MCISMLTHLKQDSTALHPKTLFKYKTSLKDTFTILPKGMGTIDALTLGQDIHSYKLCHNIMMEMEVV